MPSISDIVLNNIESISNSYALNIAEPGHVIEELSKNLRGKDSFIKTFERIDPITDRSMIAVDGGNAMEQLAGGDLLVAGATIGEGLSTKPLYDTIEEYPSEAFFEFLPHTSNNDKIQKAIRAALELRIHQQTPADIKIIDGAYLGNVSTVLYALLDSDPKVSNAILKLNNFDKDGLLKDAIKALLNPSRKNLTDVIAVVKSDSSSVFAKKFMKDYSIKEVNLTDRILASRILLPGEFFSARSMDSNPALVATIAKGLSSRLQEESLDLAALNKMVKGNQDALARLGANDITEEDVLWTTYFKPTAWSRYAKAIKIEFAFYNTTTTESLEDFTRKVVQIVDQDIVEENILEPWCQYTADVGAKGVSQAMNIIKSHLMASADEDEALRSFVRNYRT